MTLKHHARFNMTDDHLPDGDRVGCRVPVGITGSWPASGRPSHEVAGLTSCGMRHRVI